MSNVKRCIEKFTKKLLQVEKIDVKISLIERCENSKLKRSYRRQKDANHCSEVELDSGGKGA